MTLLPCCSLFICRAPSPDDPSVTREAIPLNMSLIWVSTCAQCMHAPAECASFLLICKLTAEHADGPHTWFSVIIAYASCLSHAGVTISSDSFIYWLIQMKQLFILGIFTLDFEHIFWSPGFVFCGSVTGSVLTALSNFRGDRIAHLKCDVLNNFPGPTPANPVKIISLSEYQDCWGRIKSLYASSGRTGV